jgi:hypothetical protein
MEACRPIISRRAFIASSAARCRQIRVTAAP